MLELAPAAVCNLGYNPVCNLQDSECPDKSSAAFSGEEISISALQPVQNQQYCKKLLQCFPKGNEEKSMNCFRRAQNRTKADSSTAEFILPELSGSSKSSETEMCTSTECSDQSNCLLLDNLTILSDSRNPRECASLRIDSQGHSCQKETGLHSNALLIDGQKSDDVMDISYSRDETGNCQNANTALSDENKELWFKCANSTADKEITLQFGSRISLNHDLEANEQDAKYALESKEKSNKLVNNLSHGNRSLFIKAKDGCSVHNPPPDVHRDSHGNSRARAVVASIKSTQKSKKIGKGKSSTSTICEIVNDHDNQCDIVHISAPITDCQFESQKSVLLHKNARKSTRGHICNEYVYYELPTVRTLAKSSTSRAKENCSYLVEPSLSLVSPQRIPTVSDSTATAGEDFTTNVKDRVTEAPDICVPKQMPSNYEILNNVSIHCLSNETNVTTDTVSSCQPQSVETSRAVIPFPSSEQEQMIATDHGMSQCSLSLSPCPSTKERLQTSELPGEELFLSQESFMTSSGADENNAPVSELADLRSVSLIMNRKQSIDNPEKKENPPMLVSSEYSEIDGIGDKETGTEITDAAEESTGQETSVCGNEGNEPEKSMLKDNLTDNKNSKLTLETNLYSLVKENTTVTEKKKRQKKLYGPSDRCLRSQQPQEAPSGVIATVEKSAELLDTNLKVPALIDSTLQVPALHINLFKSVGSKRFRRKVNVSETETVSFPHDCYHREVLKSIHSLDCRLKDYAEERSNGSNGASVSEMIVTRKTYKELVKEIDLNADVYVADSAFPFKFSELGNVLCISFNPVSEKRQVCFSVESNISVIKGRGSKEPEESHSFIEQQEKLSRLSVKRPLQKRDDSTHSVTPLIKGSSRVNLKIKELSKISRARRLVARAYNLRRGDKAKLGTFRKGTVTFSTKHHKELPCPSEGSDPFDLKKVDMCHDHRPVFLDWCIEEETQEHIAKYNTKYMNIQKSWVQLEKEGQSTQKIRRKADKLKEIWKSKKRIRRCRGVLESKKFSPVQMLFVKALDLSKICRWFLETTETRSLVIVKKINTVIPGDMPAVRIPLQKYSSSNIYPSSQAERLKKHLKKFAATTPARSNWKPGRMLATPKEEEGSISVLDESENIRPFDCSDSSLHGGTECMHLKSVQSLKKTASAWILKKYSNIRGKRHTHYFKRDKPSEVIDMEKKLNNRSVCIHPLVSPRLASQPKTGGRPPNKSKKSVTTVKGRKRKKIKCIHMRTKVKLGRKKLAAEVNVLRPLPHSSTRMRVPAKQTKYKNSSPVFKEPVCRRPGGGEKSSTFSKVSTLKGMQENQKLRKPRSGGRLALRSTVRRKHLRRKRPSSGKKLIEKAYKHRTVTEIPFRLCKTSKTRQNCVRNMKTQTKSKGFSENAAFQGKRKVDEKLEIPSKRKKLDAK